MLVGAKKENQNLQSNLVAANTGVSVENIHGVV